MIRRRKTGNAIFLAILLACSASAIGFSSWLALPTANSADSNISTNVGDVNSEITIDDGIYYIFNSAYSFDYYEINNGSASEYVCTMPKIGFRLKVSPTIIENIIKNKNIDYPLYINFELSYSVNSNFDMFSNNETNTNTIVPSKLSFCLEKHPQYTFSSLDVISSYSYANNTGIGTISSKSLLYEDGELCLINFIKDLSLSSDYDSSSYIFLDVFYQFNILGSFDYQTFETLTLDFAISVNQKRS